MITPIFIFSLPRSGSTLTQRILASHPEVWTASESHLLLPYLYTLREEGVYSEYSHRYTVRGIRSLYENLPNGKDEYLEEVKNLVLRIFTKISGTSDGYFVDKAGAYHLIADEIINLFGDAKIIFLWRNPLAVIASLMESWGHGRWNLHEHYIYLFEGLPQLIATYLRHKEKVLSFRFEDLLLDPEDQCGRLFRYLGLTFSKEFLTSFAEVELQGDLGDQPGMRRYQELSREPLTKWRATLSNPIRKLWCKRYLRFIGQERLATMGYDLGQLEAELEAVPMTLRHLRTDLAYIPYGFAYRFLEGKILKEKLSRLLARKTIYLHQ